MSVLPDFGPAALLLDAALRGTVLLFLALGATRLMRRASAAARHLVWSAALGGVLLLPVAGLLVPRWNVLPLPALAAPAAEAPQPAVSFAEEASPAPVPGAAPAAVESSSPAALSASPVAEAPAPRGAERIPVPDAGTLLLMAWMAVGGMLAFRLAYGAVRVWWLGRSAVEITDEGWVRAVDTLARRLRVGRIVTLLRSPGATVPMTWGVIHPVVLLPGEADAWDDERRSAVLAHELAHVRRWDALTQWVAHLAVVLFWFHPLVWMAARKLREEREHACDDAVLAMGTAPTRYADHLLQIVRALGTAEGPAAALAMARRSQFEGRLLAILDRATPRGGVTRAAALTTLGLTAALVVPLAALGAADPASPAPGSGPLGESRAAEEPSTGSAVPLTRSPGHPVTPTRESAAVAAAWKLASDADRAEYLTRLVKTRPDSSVYVEIARAAARMSSPSAQRQVLEAVVTSPDVGRAGVVAAVEAAASMRSSTDQRVVLERVAERGWLRDAAVRRAYFRTLESVAGSTDRRVLLERAALLDPSRPAKQRGIVGDTDGDGWVTRMVLTDGVLSYDDEREGEAWKLSVVGQDFVVQSNGSATRVVARPGGRVVLREAGSVTRSLEIRADSRGRETRSYTVDGVRRAYDAPAQEWTAHFLERLDWHLNRKSRTSTSRSRPTDPRRPAQWDGTQETIHDHHGKPAARFRLHASRVQIHEGEVVGMLPGGKLDVEETLYPDFPDPDPLKPRRGETTTRTLQARRRDDGTLQWTYRVNGAERPFQDEGRAWFDRILRKHTSVKTAS